MSIPLVEETRSGRRPQSSRSRVGAVVAGVRIDVIVPLRMALALAALATLIYSAPLWREHTAPPQVPPFGWAPPGLLDWPCYVVALAALVLLLSGRFVTVASVVFAVAMLVLALGDQQRWQPEIQMFVLFAMGLGATARGERARAVALALFSLYVTTVYAYSGLQKLNPSFTHDTAPWLLQPLLTRLHLISTVNAHNAWVPLGTLMACMEASLALLLFLPATRRAGVVLAVTMHAALLFVLGPFGHDWNAVIWPWNGFMIVAVPALFWNARGWFVRPLLAQPVFALVGCALALYPAGHAFGIVDTYPAHNLYSAFAGASMTCLPPAAFLVEPPAWRNELRIGVQPVDEQAWDCVDDLGWHINKLHIPPYATYRVQAALAVAACDELHASDVLLLERDPPPLFRPGSLPFRGWNRSYRGCDAVRRRATGGLLDGKPR